MIFIKCGHLIVLIIIFFGPKMLLLSYTKSL